MEVRQIPSVQLLLLLQSQAYIIRPIHMASPNNSLPPTHVVCMHAGAQYSVHVWGRGQDCERTRRLTVWPGQGGRPAREDGCPICVITRDTRRTTKEDVFVSLEISIAIACQPHEVARWPLCPFAWRSRTTGLNVQPSSWHVLLAWLALYREED
ncbi:hypothetical protein DL95DRAFT_162639 [Leptodontidium sp. 2 PMI_412]|nr:hypothetical protein DL95DRAFT_162639 [Leptodontidium sp. 2 PMI_412]